MGLKVPFEAIVIWIKLVFWLMRTRLLGISIQFIRILDVVKICDLLEFSNYLEFQFIKTFILYYRICGLLEFEV